MRKRRDRSGTSRPRKGTNKTRSKPRRRKATPARPGAGNEPRLPPAAGPPSYHEGRLVAVDDSQATLGRELREMEARCIALREAVERLERALRSAVHEIVPPSTSSPSEEVATESPVPPATVLPAPPDALALAEIESKPPSGRFATFTVEKYNRAIGTLKDRRVSLARWTVALAVVISGVLVTLSLLAREPTPPIWFAALPAVWLVCVPFFLVSFLSTQRVLRRNHLVLPEAS